MEGAGHLRGAEPAGGTTWPDGWSVWHVAETGSTNVDLLAVSGPDGADHRTVLFADHQTAGRGRLDRTWTAPSGANLLVSALFRDVPDDPGELTRRIGLAAVDAVHSLGGVAQLKWPNDVMLGDCKLGGILAQRAESGAVIVGLGLNVGWSPEGAADLRDVAPGLEPAAMLRLVLSAFDALPADVTERYRAALATLGRRVRIELPAGELIGVATEVEPDGRLMVLDDCAITHRVAVGDVVHLRADRT